MSFEKHWSVVNRMILEFDRVSFAYGQTPVIQDLSLGINEGDFVGILGRNGSGKTTLIKLALGLEKPADGMIHVFNQPGQKALDWNRIGYVPQQRALDKTFPATVRELLSLRKGNLRPLVTTLGLTELLDQKFSELSGGQQQRVLLGFCLLSKPSLLILDEPEAGVDLKTQRQFYALLRKLNHEKKLTIVLITHEAELVTRYAKTVVFLENGKIRAKGPASQAYALLNEIYGETFHPREHRLQHD